MLVVLLRHALAEPRSDEKADRERRLTAAGCSEMMSVGISLAHFLPNAEMIYTSPARRAQETAECISAAYRGRLPIEITNALSPNADTAEFVLLLAGTEVECAYFVGHEPHLTRVLHSLTRTAAVGEQGLARCGCYILSYERGTGQATLRWPRY